MAATAGNSRTTITVEEAAHALGISRGSAYRSAREFLDSGGRVGIPVIQIGRRLLVPITRFEAFLSGDKAE